MLKLKPLLTKILKAITHAQTTSVAVGNNASGALNIAKYGRLVIMSGIIHNNIAGINLLVTGIPMEYAPLWDTWISCNIYGATSGCEAHVAAANGGVYLSYPVAGSDIKVCGVWLAASTTITA